MRLYDCLKVKFFKNASWISLCLLPIHFCLFVTVVYTRIILFCPAVIELHFNNHSSSPLVFVFRCYFCSCSM